MPRLDAWNSLSLPSAYPQIFMAKGKTVALEAAQVIQTHEP